jgi:hypothetical protein
MFGCCFLPIGNLFKNDPESWAPMAHTCNPGSSGGRDQKDHDLKPVRANSSGDPISKNLSQKVQVLSSNTSTEKKKYHVYRLLLCLPLSDVYLCLSCF